MAPNGNVMHAKGAWHAQQNEYLLLNKAHAVHQLVGGVAVGPARHLLADGQRRDAINGVLDGSIDVVRRHALARAALLAVPPCP
jgi:hypothetical protein